MVTKASASLNGGVGNSAIAISKSAGRNRTPTKAFTTNKIWRIIPTRMSVLIVSSFDVVYATSLNYYIPMNFPI